MLNFFKWYSVCCIHSILFVGRVFHNHPRYGLLLWGYSSHTDRILGLQKAAIGILAVVGIRDHCRPLLYRLQVLTVTNQFICDSVCHIKKKIELWTTRQETHGFGLIGENNYLGAGFSKLSKVSISRIWCFTISCLKIWQCRLLKSFESQVGQWLGIDSFYSLEEFYGQWPQLSLSYHHHSFFLSIYFHFLFLYSCTSFDVIVCEAVYPELVNDLAAIIIR